jgi:CIC family chloride channel protein
MTYLKKITERIFTYIIPVSLVTGFLAAIFAVLIRFITEKTEHELFNYEGSTPFVIVSPIIGLAVIYFLRKYLFHNKKNTGIKELLETIEHSKNHLAPFKIISHFVNGTLTVITGGSTGIEVSTVVSSGAIGNTLAKKTMKFLVYKNVFICSGAAAGLTALFGSPLAGLCFSVEVLKARFSIYQFVSFLFSIGIAGFTSYLLDTKAMFPMVIANWNFSAFPYFILLGILAGINSAYLTKSVLLLKKLNNKISNDLLKFAIPGLAIGIILLFIPELYGDGYETISDMLVQNKFSGFTSSLIIMTLIILLLKPFITALTLSGGGDGGVFAPSLFLGAFLGLITSTLLNHYFNAQVLETNFIVVGMAAVLSSSINAPLTATFLVCSITGTYILIVPILITCLVSKIIARILVPYTVYSYKG